MDKLIGRKIELLPKAPKELEENQAICSTCDGIGWLESETKGYITKCPDCYGKGFIYLCQFCSKPMIRGICMSEECDKKLQAFYEKERLKNEKIRYDKAKKYTIDTAPPENKIMLYSNIYEYNEGYFPDIEELTAYCAEKHINLPTYVWGTDALRLSFDAEDIVMCACEELWEGAYDSIDGHEIAELQQYLDKWALRQKGANTYTTDYKCCILI